ncbi:MAG: hypothetical protein WA776_04165 [Xanthobacteraceae bacterium]
MKITADVREYASGLSDNEKAALYLDAAQAGTDQMSKKFLDMGAEVYVYKAEADKRRIGQSKQNSPPPRAGRGRERFSAGERGGFCFPRHCEVRARKGQRMKGEAYQRAFSS